MTAPGSNPISQEWSPFPPMVPLTLTGPLCQQSGPDQGSLKEKNSWFHFILSPGGSSTPLPCSMGEHWPHCGGLCGFVPRIPLCHCLVDFFFPLVRPSFFILLLFPHTPATWSCPCLAPAFPSLLPLHSPQPFPPFPPTGHFPVQTTSPSYLLPAAQLPVQTATPNCHGAV